MRCTFDNNSYQIKYGPNTTTGAFVRNNVFRNNVCENAPGVDSVRRGQPAALLIHSLNKYFEAPMYNAGILVCGNTFRNPHGDPGYVAIRAGQTLFETTVPTLLLLLHRGSTHGYTLLEQLSRFGLGSLHPSVVYRTLRDMEELGWIASDWDTSQTQGPPRRTYRMAPPGEEALRNWRRELIHSQDLIAQLLARMGF